MYEFGPDRSPRCRHIRVTRAQVEAARILVRRGNHRRAIVAIAETRLPDEPNR